MIPQVVSSCLRAIHTEMIEWKLPVWVTEMQIEQRTLNFSTMLLVRPLTTAESLTTNWVIVQSIISFLHPSRSERATAGVNSLIGETRSLHRTIRENSGINWVWLRELFNGKQRFFAWHNWRSDGASGGVVGASVLWVCLCDRQTAEGGRCLLLY